jgi:hypothetical protein
MSQRDVGKLIGDAWQTSRHERGITIPPLFVALAYEVIFKAPVSVLFAGLHAEAARSIEANRALHEPKPTLIRGNHHDKRISH